MCLVPGLADGRFLTDNELLPEELAVNPDACRCGDHATPGVSRREMLTRTALAATGMAVAGPLLLSTDAAVAQRTSGGVTGDRIRMLGVNGGPVLSKVHSQPSIDLIVNNTQYLIDCGGDAPRQVVNAGDGFSNLRHVFVTHHHFDHMVGVAELATLGWCYVPSPLRKLSIWGPPPISSFVRNVKHAYEFGARLFEIGVDFPPWLPITNAREFSLPKSGIRKVMEDDNVVVHATRVFHGREVHDAYGYRFDIKRTRKSVVFSGDTAAPNKHLETLARDADVLVHQVQMSSLVPAFLQHVEPKTRKTWSYHLYKSLANVVDVPTVAKAANAKRLVFCHYGLSPDPAAFLAVGKQVAAKIHYGGEIIAPTELDEIAL